MELAYIVYLSVFAVTILCAFVATRSQRYESRYWMWAGIAIVFYTLAAGLRAKISIDINPYARMFDKIGLGYSSLEDVDTDMIYYIFLPVVKYLHFNVFTGFLALMIIFFIFRIFQDKPQLLVFYCLFFSVSIIFHH